MKMFLKSTIARFRKASGGQMNCYLIALLTVYVYAVAYLLQSDLYAAGNIDTSGIDSRIDGLIQYISAILKGNFAFLIFFLGLVVAFILWMFANAYEYAIKVLIGGTGLSAVYYIASGIWTAMGNTAPVSK